jgi:DNA ligase-1
MEFPTLYKRTKTGAIQQWSVFVTIGLAGAIIIKRAGQLNGTLTEHREVISVGKNIGKSNETTPLQQAEAQAQSDWTKKHDEGYKSLNDLDIVLCTDKIHFPGLYMYPGCGIMFMNLEYSLNQTLPKFNSDAAGNAKPMLAKPVDWKKVTYPCYVQPKLDGVRCLMIVKSYHLTADITFLSRSGKEYTTLNHIKDDVLNYIAGSEQEFILDGEIYSENLSFQEIVSAVKKQRPESLKLHFRAYDIVNDKKQHQRIEQVRELIDLIDSKYIQYVITITAAVKDDVTHHHDKWVSEGNEGAMIRHYNGIYGQGQRSSDLLKVKEFDETEFEFKCFEQGQREEDLIAVCETLEKKEFRAKMIGNKLSKATMQTECGELQGTQLTVKHFGWTTDGLPRFPIGKSFRDY